MPTHKIGTLQRSSCKERGSEKTVSSLGCAFMVAIHAVRICTAGFKHIIVSLQTLMGTNGQDS